MATPEEELFPLLYNLPNPPGLTPPAALQFNTATNMTLEHVHITWSHGLGLLTLNSLGYCSITNCKLGNNGRTKDTRIGGNAYIAYELTEIEQILTKNVLEVSHSTICYGINNSTIDHSLLIQFSTSAGGMMIVIPMQYQLDVLILSCTFHHNEAQYGGNHQNRFNSTYVGGLSLLRKDSAMDKAFSKSTSIQVEILVSNSSFIYHKGGGFYSEIFGSLQILNSRFIDNTVLPRCYAPPFCDLLPGKRGGGVTTRTCAFASQLSPPPPLPRIRVLYSAVEDENSFDRHAVAVLKDGRVVGHVHVAKHSR